MHFPLYGLDLSLFPLFCLRLLAFALSTRYPRTTAQLYHDPGWGTGVWWGLSFRSIFAYARPATSAQFLTILLGGVFAFQVISLATSGGPADQGVPSISGFISQDYPIGSLLPGLVEHMDFKRTAYLDPIHTKEY
jgi:hypothetical protein